MNLYTRFFTNIPIVLAVSVGSTGFADSANNLALAATANRPPSPSARAADSVDLLSVQMPAELNKHRLPPSTDLQEAKIKNLNQFFGTDPANSWGRPAGGLPGCAANGCQ